MTRYYTQTQENLADLQTIEELLYAPSLRGWGNKVRSYIPAGAVIAQNPADLGRSTYDHLETNVITLDLKKDPGNLVIADDQTRLAYLGPIYAKLQELTKDLPFVKTAPAMTMHDAKLHLCDQLGEVGAGRLFAAAGIDGIEQGGKTFLINPSVVDTVRIQGRLIGHSADPIIQTVRPDGQSQLPQTEAALLDRYIFVDDMAHSGGFARLYESKQTPGSFVVTKAEASPDATLDSFLAFRLARAMGAPTPAVLCRMDQNARPLLICEYIAGHNLNKLGDRDVSAYQAFRIEQALELANMPWMILDYSDPNAGNYLIGSDHATPIVIDAGGALRYYAWGHRKEDARPGVTDWCHAAPVDALFCERKSRSPLSASFTARAHRIDQIWTRRAQLKMALNQAADEITASGACRACFNEADYTKPALHAKILDHVQLRLTMAHLILSDQAAVANPNKPRNKTTRLNRILRGLGLVKKEIA